jgi:[acyl-carrier-protein] S-malonyltransferase
MGRQACEAVPAARALFDRASGVLGYDLAQLCFDGPADKLNSTVYSQPALFVCGLAAVEVLRHESPQVVDDCQAVAGLSLGEYCALVFAEVMDFETALAVVKRRGEAMQAASDATPSGMVSILGLELDKVEQLCDDARRDQVLQAANHLCPANIAISGHRAACQRAVEMAPVAGAMKAIPLAVAGAFHTEIMRSAVSELEEVLESATLHAPRIPVVSNVDALPHSDPSEIRDLLVKQVVSPVQWERTVRFLMAEGAETFYEVGPGRVLRGLLKRIERKMTCEGVAV